MRRVHPLTFLLPVVVGLTLGCGGSSTTSPGTNGNSSNSSGNGRTMTATFNGASFQPTLLTSAYLNGQVAVNAADGTRSLSIQAVNVQVPGVYSLVPGNANSAIAQWIDGTGTYSTGYTGGTGTVTFTVLQLGRVAGSFTFTVKNSSGPSTIALNGTFDIKFP